ncbi:hypothetical protein [Vibrio ishigakensis]|nr:hypothetical protein [Vibrio ishigakensis]
MTLSLALVMGIYSMYLLQQVSQSLEWQNRLMLSRNQLDLELDNALNCFALHFPDSEPCQTAIDYVFNSQVISANRLELSVGLDEAKVSQTIELGSDSAGMAMVHADDAIESVFGRTLEELATLLDGQITSLDPASCSDALLAQLQLGVKSLSISGDCEISEPDWQAITSYQPLLLLFSQGRVWIRGSALLEGGLVMAPSNTSADWSHFSSGAQGFASEDLAVIEDIQISGGLQIAGRAAVDTVHTQVDPVVMSKVLTRFATRRWSRWSWHDE